MKINYPIKYAAMPIIKQIGWSSGLHELEREYGVVCYIVSKCYLISNLTRYLENGRSFQQYEIVFPYQKVKFNRWQRVIPTYNSIHGNCINGNKVDIVFDSYEEALNFVTTKNEELCKKTYIYLPYSENYVTKVQKKINEFNETLEEYKLLEQEILLRTENMLIGSNRELTNVIKIENNNSKISSYNIYEILQLFNNEKFVVYNVSQEQYDNLTKLISEGKNDEIKSLIGLGQGLVIHKTKDDFIKLAIEECCGAYYIQNNIINYDYKLDIVTLKSFENIDEDTLIFYTTETIDDLCKSYRNYSEIDLEEVKGPILKKKNK